MFQGSWAGELHSLTEEEGRAMLFIWDILEHITMYVLCQIKGRVKARLLGETDFNRKGFTSYSQ